MTYLDSHPVDTLTPTRVEMIVHAAECAIADLRSDLDLSKDAPGCGGDNARAFMLRYLDAALYGKEEADVQ